MWQVYAQVFFGWQAVMRGEDVAGTEQMRSAIAGWQAKGMVAGTDALILALADGCLAGADAARASLLETGLAAIGPWLGPDAPCGFLSPVWLRPRRC
jgi:hypothetical protein